MAHKKGQGSSAMAGIVILKGAVSKYLPAKNKRGLYHCATGRNKIHPGNNVGLGKDFTIFSLITAW